MARNHAIAMSLLLASMVLSSCAIRKQRYSDFQTPTPFTPGNTLVIGFLGGREPWHNTKVGVGRLAVELRREVPADVHVETVENTKRGLAMQFVKKGLDRDANGVLDESELRSARIILYGQSFGGAAVVKFARQLDAIGVPVMLSIQVDSIGRDDELVPPNVKMSANLYQKNGLIIHGADNVRALDPERTTILFNRRFDYRGKYQQVRKFPWYLEPFQTPHMRMDNDPAVWCEVKRLILAELDAERR
jgi:hypothetical protein